MDDYKRWKFLERWGLWQMLAGVILFVGPLFFTNKYPNQHIIWASLMLAGFVLVFISMFMVVSYGGKRSQVEWNEKYVRCPHCKIGWMKRG